MSIILVSLKKTSDQRQYSYTIQSDPVFSFKVIRESDNAVVFDTALGGLTVADQFLQIGAKLNSSNVFGFGEHVRIIASISLEMYGNNSDQITKYKKEEMVKKIYHLTYFCK